jgi:hypothetical protein
MSEHEPFLYASRYGCWCWCLCGWSSGETRYRSVFGAHLAFGRHLLAAPR